MNAHHPAAAALRNRIVAHRTVPASALKPHPLNFRTHSPEQRGALAAVLAEVGYARSVLAYVADADRDTGALTLIDGHLRAEELADAPVTVEVLDVTDDEARKLLLTLDPLAALAGVDDEQLATLRDTVASDADALNNLWGSIRDANRAVAEALKKSAARSKPAKDVQHPGELFLVLVECDDERHQIALLQRFKAEGLRAKAQIT